MTSIYLTGAALDELAQAQAVIDKHLVACGVCGTNKPCQERRQAEHVFVRYGQLPKRRPGVTIHGVWG